MDKDITVTLTPDEFAARYSPIPSRRCFDVLTPDEFAARFAPCE